ncbi:hypothetical protein QBC39DRAFT_264138 [Podospora conica]|nr:hypothetical protein QBC39DRAFT_264138 [Schizothecium conicum]
MPRQHLTPNACLVCRKKRTKCDGQLPCRRCRSRGEECSYEDKKWRTKDHLRSEIERLRAEQQQGHAIIQALANNDPGKWEVVLDRMRSEDSPDAIAQWIQATSSLPTTPQRPQRANTTGTAVLDGSSPPHMSFVGSAHDLRRDSLSNFTFGNAESPDASRGRLFSAAVPSDHTFPGRLMSDASPEALFGHRDHGLLPMGRSVGFDTDMPPPFHRGSLVTARPSTPELFQGPVLVSWTTVTPDLQLVQQLVGKFFSSPSSLLHVSQAQFLKDFCEGNQRYCSAALINVILGRACRLLDCPSQLISQVSFGDAFLGEARRLLAAELTHCTIPSIQALGLMALTEMGQGNDDEAWDLAQESVRSSILLALQTQLLPPLDGDDKAVWALSFCGGFTVMRLLRLLTGRLEPNAGPLFMRLQPDGDDLGEDAPKLRLERGISLQMQFFAELPACPPLARFLFEITETVHTFSAYNFAKAMTANDLVEAHQKCLGSYSDFTGRCSSDPSGTADGLFAHIWYHYCLLSLLRPFVNNTKSLTDGVVPKLRNDDTPRDVCEQSSEAIICMTSTYQRQYSLKRVFPALPHMVLSAVLYQLTMAIDPRHESSKQPAARQSTAHGPPRRSSEHSFRPPIPFTSPRFPKHAGPHPPPSPTLMMQSERARRRRASAFAGTTNSPLNPNPAKLQSSASSETSSSDSDDSTSPFSSSNYNSTESGGFHETNVLPVFTSSPADLFTIGSLQLICMSASHGGAAEAARILRQFGNIDELAGSGISPEALLERASLLQGVGGFWMDMLRAGLGMEVREVPFVGVVA